MADSLLTPQIKRLVKAEDFRISEHALDALLEDNLGRDEVIATIETAETLEDYPEFGKGPAVLLLQTTSSGCIIHTVWGIPKGAISPAVLITVYIPDPDHWDETLKVRK